MRLVVQQWAKETRFDAVIVSASSLVSYARLDAMRHVPAIVDLVDVDSQKWLDYSATSHWPKSRLFAIEARRLRALESGLPSWARAVTLVSQAELALYRGIAGVERSFSITNGVDLEYFRPQPASEESTCVFVGALDYRPNIDAACWFVAEVWPHVRELRPELRFTIVGRRPTAAVRQLASNPGVEVVGQVPDVRPFVARASIVVVPLRLARGVQNKVLEALAMGKATIASPPALAGLKARPDEHLLSATTPMEWVRAIDSLLVDAERRRQLGIAGRKYVEQFHTWDQCLRPFEEFLEPP
jgi:sugar transferase (PEP-CTERM/EpsH1 system associated)